MVSLLCASNLQVYVPSLRMYRYQQSRRPLKGGKELSALARGTGLLSGGVEIECYPDYLNNLSLSGKAFLKPSPSPQGQYAKPYKPHVLALPKTYVTRRGQIVLFTSPDDMIIGKTCQVHQRATEQKSVSNSAAHHLKTTNSLVSSALNYEPEKDSGISDGEGDGSPPQPGHFTSTYLDRLQQRVPTINVEGEENFINEDSEAKPQHEADIPVSETDSGLEITYHVPRGGAVVVPDGQWSEEEGCDGESDRKSPQQVRFTDDTHMEVLAAGSTGHQQPIQNEDKRAQDRAKTNELSEIMFELDQAAPIKTPSTKKKGSGGSSSRSGRRKGQKNGTVSRPAPVKQQEKQECKASDKTASDLQKKKAKGNSKKRVKRQKRSATKDADDEDPSLSETVDEPKDSSTGISAVQLAERLDDPVVANQPSAEGEEGLVSTAECDSRQRRRSLQLERAEERRREIERKRLEKRQLEQQRQEEEAKKQELLEKLALEAKQLSIEKKEEETIKLVAKTAQEESDLNGRLADLEALRQAERTKLLEYRGEQFERMLSSAELEAQEAIMRSKQIRERVMAEEERRRREQHKKELERQRRLKEDEEQQIQQKKEEEEQSRRAIEKARLQAVEETGRKLKGKEEMNYKMRLELQTQRHYQQLTSHFFSYFRYVPPATSSSKNKRKNTVRTKKK